MPLHHVSFRGRGSLVGPRPVRYFSVAAPTSADALRIVEESVGGDEGEFTVQRADKTFVESTQPRIIAAAVAAAS